MSRDIKRVSRRERRAALRLIARLHDEARLLGVHPDDVRVEARLWGWASRSISQPPQAETFPEMIVRRARRSAPDIPAGR